LVGARTLRSTSASPDWGPILGAWVLAEFGDYPNRYQGARPARTARHQPPITRATGSKKVVLARHLRNKRLADALHLQAFCALRRSPGARA
jgi:hypothetical protein